VSKDTRTAWGQEFDAKQEAWPSNSKLKSELVALREQLAKVTAERDEKAERLTYALGVIREHNDANAYRRRMSPKRDLEQQAKGVQLAQEYLSFNSMSKDTIAIHELIDLEQDLRKQATEIGNTSRFKE